LEPDGEETRLRLTEHGAFFDGHNPERGPADAENPPEAGATEVSDTEIRVSSRSISSV
jgi:hypothetical protein